MKILFYIYSLGAGGAERVVVTLANHLVASGHHVAVVTLADIEADFYRTDPGVDRITFNHRAVQQNFISRFFDSILRIFRLRSVLRRFRPQLAIAMMDSASVSLAFAGFGLKGTTCVGSERVYPAFSPSSLPWKILRRWTYGLLHGIAALTDENVIWLRQHTLVRRTWIIPNPVVLPMSVVPPVRSPDEARVCRHRLLAVGRYVPQKGFDLLIDSFSSLANRFPDWELVIAGEGPERERLQTMLEGRPWRNRVSLTGPVGNIGDWYASADIFVLSSRFEGFPNTLLEAMAHGVAVVASDCPTGPRALIDDGVNGLLVLPDEPAALAAALERLMADEQLRFKLGESAQEARKRFSVQAIANLWTNIVEHKS
jgi:glycosyltransferase involved in cell wall biosynthesis